MNLGISRPVRRQQPTPPADPATDIEYQDSEEALSPATPQAPADRAALHAELRRLQAEAERRDAEFNALKQAILKLQSPGDLATIEQTRAHLAAQRQAEAALAEQIRQEAAAHVAREAERLRQQVDEHDRAVLRLNRCLAATEQLAAKLAALERAAAWEPAPFPEDLRLDAQRFGVELPPLPDPIPPMRPDLLSPATADLVDHQEAPGDVWKHLPAPARELLRAAGQALLQLPIGWQPAAAGLLNNPTVWRETYQRLGGKQDGHWVDAVERAAGHDIAWPLAGRIHRLDKAQVAATARWLLLGERPREY